MGEGWGWTKRNCSPSPSSSESVKKLVWCCFTSFRPRIQYEVNSSRNPVFSLGYKYSGPRFSPGRRIECDFFTPSLRRGEGMLLGECSVELSKKLLKCACFRLFHSVPGPLVIGYFPSLPIKGSAIIQKNVNFWGSLYGSRPIVISRCPFAG